MLDGLRADRVRAGAVILDAGRLAVIERHRDGHHYFTLPGGGVEEGETVEEAAAREVLEELGIEIELMGLIGTVTLTRGSWVTLQVYFAARAVGGLFGSGTGPEHQPDHDPTLGTYRPTWLDLEEAAAAIVHPRELVGVVGRDGIEALLRDPVDLEEVGPRR